MCTSHSHLLYSKYLLGTGEEKGGYTKGKKETSGGDWYVFYYLVCGDDNMCICISKITKLYILIMCSFLYTNYTSIKLEGKKKVSFLGQQCLLKNNALFKTMKHSFSQIVIVIRAIIKFIWKYKF